MNKYIPETSWQSTEDMVYTLKQGGWAKGEPQMVNDVWITVHAPEEHKEEIAREIAHMLNERFPSKDNKAISMYGVKMTVMQYEDYCRMLTATRSVKVTAEDRRAEVIPIIRVTHMVDKWVAERIIDAIIQDQQGSS